MTFPVNVLRKQVKSIANTVLAEYILGKTHWTILYRFHFSPASEDWEPSAISSTEQEI